MPLAKTAAILISRQPLRPCGATPWVARTRAALAWLKEQAATLCTSTGMQTWDLITTLGSAEYIPLRVFLATSQAEFPFAWNAVFHQFGLHPDLTELVPLLSDNMSGAREDALLRRDEAILREAQLIIPISVRRDGHMHALIEQARLDGKEIITSFQLAEPTPTPSLAYRLNPDDFSPEIDTLGQEYVWHWTRTTNSAWPGERLADYYIALSNSHVYPRSAFETLRRIMTMGRIAASARHMPGNIATVSFTELTPREVIPLMKWRARYTEMSFEPYGLGILKSAAEKLGVRPVRYIAGKQRSVIADDEPWLWQSTGIRTDWRQEKECRHKGDLFFGHLDKSALVAFCRFPEEAAAIRQEFGVRALSFMLTSMGGSGARRKQKAGSS